MDDVFEAARSRINPSLIHEMFQCAGSFTRTGEYYILSPLRSDRHVGSFSINERSGLWRDKATDESGDFISLVAQVKGITPLEAAKLIVGDYKPYVITAAEKEEKEKQEESLPKPIIPIPQTDEIIEKLKRLVAWFSDRSNFDDEKLWFGEATKVYRYFDYDGGWKFAVVRFEKKPDETRKKRVKNDIMFYYGEVEKVSANGTVEKTGKWKAKRHKDLMPFQPYGIENIKDSTLPILPHFFEIHMRL
jgi:hypothetical protein